MQKNLDMSDDKFLINAADKGNQNAVAILYNRYRNIGEKHVRISFANRNYTKYTADEFIGEIDIAFIIAFHKFDRNSPSFRAYFTAILNNCMNKYIAKLLKSNDALKHYVSLDRNSDGFSFYELIEDTTIDPNLAVNEKLDAELQIRSFETGLSKKKKDLVKAMIILKAQGYTMKEIADLLNVSESTISRLYFKFRQSINSR